jgi:glycolate oxidase iron-sulfur subunit
MSSRSLPCVHCGLCLDTCPTYRVLGMEADSPRGRIYLMEAIERGVLPLDREASSHLDSCLSCLACETACPSGVNFHSRIDAFRPRLVLPPARRAARALVQYLSQSRAALRAGLASAHALDAVGLQALRRRIPGLQIFPRRSARRTGVSISSTLTSRIPPPTKPRARVALLTGCAANTLAPSITRAAVETLYSNGVGVVDVPEQGCCGALALHAGDDANARACIESNTRAFNSADVDFVVTTAAGCGAVLKQYGELADASLRHESQRVAGRARDISEVLYTIGIARPSHPLRLSGPVAYHDACHLLHAAKVSQPPRAVLAAAMSSSVIDLGDNHLCCGSAGTYSLEKPRIAAVLGSRKAQLVESCGAVAVAVGNVGCMLQIELSLARRGTDISVVHPIELLAEAYVRSL